VLNFTFNNAKVKFSAKIHVIAHLIALRNVHLVLAQLLLVLLLGSLTSGPDRIGRDLTGVSPHPHFLKGGYITTATVVLAYAVFTLAGLTTRNGTENFYKNIFLLQSSRKI